MKAIVSIPAKEQLKMIETPEPGLTGADQVKIKVCEVGISEMDRQRGLDNLFALPSRKDEIIVGQEMVGRVIEVGKGVKSLRVGDFCVVTVRRGCDQCPACLKEQEDMCYDVRVTERGRFRLDGFQTEYIVDQEKYILKLPENLRPLGVFALPAAIAYKAISMIGKVQIHRLPGVFEPLHWWRGRRVLISGMGVSGLLTALELRSREAEVFGMDIYDKSSFRARFLEEMGGKYIEGHAMTPDQVLQMLTGTEVVIETTGSVPLEYWLPFSLGRNGICLLMTYSSQQDKINALNGGRFLNNLLKKNQLLMGCSGANVQDYKKGFEILKKGYDLFGTRLYQWITSRLSPSLALTGFSNPKPDEMRGVVDWEKNLESEDITVSPFIEA